MAGSDSLNVRFWPPIFQRPPWHFSALEVVFPSFSVFSCISIGVFRRPLSLQCPCTDAVFLGFSAKIDLRGPESSWRALKNRRPALPLNGHLRKTLPAVGIPVFLKPEIPVLEPLFCVDFSVCEADQSDCTLARAAREGPSGRGCKKFRTFDHRLSKSRIAFAC